MRSRLVISLVLLAVVIAGGVLNAYLTRTISDRYVSAAEELLVLTESGQWQRAADTAGAYHETWDETLSWLQMLINHEDGDSLSRALLMVEAGIRTRDVSLCVQGCNEMKEAAQHLYHRDAFTLGNVL